MIEFKNVLELMEKCKTPNVIITDLHGNKIYHIENTTVSSTVNELEHLEPVLKSYGKLQFKAAGKGENQKNANFKGGYQWTVFFDKTPINTQLQPNNWMGAAPPGFVSNDVMMAKLEKIQSDIEWGKKLQEAENKNQGIGQVLPLMPYVMQMFGKSDTEIIKAQTQSQAMAGAPKNTLTFSDVEKMTSEQKNNKIEKLMESLADKVSAEHMILLLEALNNKPELAIKAINFLPML